MRAKINRSWFSKYESYYDRHKNQYTMSDHHDNIFEVDSVDTDDRYYISVDIRNSQEGFYCINKESLTLIDDQKVIEPKYNKFLEELEKLDRNTK